MHRLGHQRIGRAGRCVDEPRPAAEKKAVPEEDAQEIDRRVHQQLEPRRLLAERDALLRFQPGVDDFLLHLLVERQPTLVAQQSLARDCGPAVGDEAFVDDEVDVEPGAPSSDEPQYIFRARPEADRSETSVKRQRAAQLPAGYRVIDRSKARQFGPQLVVEPFIRIDAENPRVRRLIERKLLLAGVAEPGLMNEPDWNAAA